MAKAIELSELNSTRSKKSAKSSAKKKTQKIEEEVIEKKKKKKKKRSKSIAPVIDIEPKKKKKKKKRSESIDTLIDIEPKKKKKKKKSKDKELTVSKKRDNKKKKLKEKAQVMEGQLEVLIHNNPNIKEHDQFQEYVYIFESLQDIARIKEEQCRNNKAQSKDVYALMQVYNQMRDVIADIRALRDISQVADEICVDVLEPYAQSSAGTLMDFYQNIEQYARRNLDDHQITPFVKQLKMYAKAGGAALQSAYEISNSKTLQVLSSQ